MCILRVIIFIAIEMLVPVGARHRIATRIIALQAKSNLISRRGPPLFVSHLICEAPTKVVTTWPRSFHSPFSGLQEFSSQQCVLKSYIRMYTPRSSDPLVWIDCEMTGLDYSRDRILSISCFITTHNLELLDAKGYHAIISTPKQILDNMSSWCVETHGRTGLTQACLSSTTSATTAAEELLTYIKSHVPLPRRALLAGNSVHADRMFLLQQPWTPVTEWLHYRLFDISAIKEAAKRWCSDEVLNGVPPKQLVHSAEADIKESMQEARYYMKLFERMSANPVQETNSSKP